jgi:hypothetical protein
MHKGLAYILGAGREVRKICCVNRAILLTEVRFGSRWGLLLPERLICHNVPAHGRSTRPKHLNKNSDEGYIQME